MRIPDGMDVVILADETIDALSERMEIDKALLRNRLAQDRETKVQSRYVFFLYYSKPLPA